MNRPGTVPVAFEVDAERGDALVHDVDPSTFVAPEPFAVQTAARLVSDGCAPRRLPLAALAAELASLGGPLAPAGFVVHTGRCGSTLLTNLLEARGDVLVVREPEAVAALLERAARLSGEEQARAEAGLRAVVRSYTTVAARSGRLAIVKLASPCASLAPALAARYPRVPLVGVWRDPAATVASGLEGPAGWATRAYDPSEVQARWWPILARPRTEPLTLARFLALCWASGVDGLLGVPAAQRHLLRYDDLVSEANDVVEKVSRWFDLGPSAADEADVRAAATTYAKDPAAREAFDPAERHRRAPLPPDVEADVEGLTNPAVQRLRNAGQRP